jgi:hypothetical protein
LKKFENVENFAKNIQTKFHENFSGGIRAVSSRQTVVWIDGQTSQG